MLIIPTSGKLTWKTAPAITIFLILMNCFVFFFLQGNEYQQYIEAEKYYVQSGLGEIEASFYLPYLKQTGQEDKLNHLKNFPGDKEETLLLIHQEIEHDDDFLRKVKELDGLRINKGAYAKWRELRNQYEKLQHAIITYKYGYKPAAGNPLNAFTYMFLHGGMGHLVGNMIFLWLVGSLIEIGCSRISFGIIYLVTGIFAAVFFGMIYRHSTVPLIGASGAISGIMGFCAVLYGMRRIKVFYSLGFYFANARIPAIILLPLWVGNELLQLFFGGISNVAYVAHLGGLISGGVLGIGYKRFIGGVEEVVFEDEQEDKVASLMEKGLQQITDLNFTAGRKHLVQVLDIEPHNRRAILHLYNIDKQNPTSDTFHDTADRLFASLSQDVRNSEELKNLYNEYKSLVGQPRLSPELCTKMISIFLARGYLNETAGILAYLLRHHGALPQIPGELLKLAQAYLKKGVIGQANKCLNVLCKKYPGTAEQEVALELMNRNNSGQ